jgi:trehalose/maltose hydrolase-like predicted phosphorylase
VSDAEVVGTILLDWNAVKTRVGEFRGRLELLFELGVDVGLVTSEPNVTVRLGTGQAGPGRLFVIGPSGKGRLRAEEKLRPNGPGESLSGRGPSPDGEGPEAQRAFGGDASAVLGQLDRVIESQEGFPVPIGDSAWTIEVDGFDPLREREVESWFTVANGRTGTRGSVEEGDEESMPATYVAGLYGKTEDDPPGIALVRGPEWTRLAPRAGREGLDLDEGKVIEHRRVLDLRQGILFRTWRHQLPSGTQVAFRSARIASLADRELLALVAEARSSGSPMRLADGIPSPGPAGSVASAEATSDDGVLLMDFRARGGGGAFLAIKTAEAAGRLRRLVAVATRVGDRPGGTPHDVLLRAEREGHPRIWARHRAAWRERWRDADVVVEGDPDAQRALRFALYHLISAGDPESDLVSIGARGLTGPGYRGHVFWDAESFLSPFFVYTHPPMARVLLAYRHRTLPAARAKAAGFGYRGALYAWESALTGEETAPLHDVGPDGSRVAILTGLQEHHISADVAWAAWRYFQATGDEEFLSDMGAEIVLETARFWASRARKGPDGRYHIGHIIGPDEYHEGVRDSAFTNVMARWNLERGLEVAELSERLDLAAWRGLVRGLGFRPREFRRWREVADGLVDGFDPDTLLYEQFAGFFALEDLRAEEIAPRPFLADMIVGRDRVRRSQLVKQADVVMLAHMLPELVPAEVAAANYRYYEPRTTHGSSLSPAIHASVAARTGQLDEAAEYLRMAAAIDLGNRMGNAAQGIHMAAMGGLWQAAVMGFGGLRPEGDALRIDPRLPGGWTRLAFPVRWRGGSIRMDFDRTSVRVSVDVPTLVALGAGGPGRLLPGRYAAVRRSGRWGRLEVLGAS